MRWVWVLVLLSGVGLGSVGILWFLQGSDLVHMDPLLCAADCRPIVGHQPAWQVAGGVTTLVGALTAVLAARKLRAAAR